MDQATAAAIMDWLDDDDVARDEGAESEFYATLTRPIAPRNGMPFELDELLFVRGVTSQKLYGKQTEIPNALASFGLSVNSDMNAMYSRERSEPSNGTGLQTDTVPARPWIDMLTLYSAERNESYTGQRRVFVNGDDLPDLHKQLTAQIPQEWADFILLYRQFGPSSSSLADNDNSNDISIKIDLDAPAEFKIETLVDLIGTAVSVPPENEEEEPTIVPSPVREDSMAAANLEQVFDQLTVVASRRIIGRVNINDAPVEVLETLPALSVETVQRIVRTRETRHETETAHIHPIWLLTNNLVDLPTMRALLPDVTCGGDVYRAQVWGRAQDQSPTYRFEIVLDATGRHCQSSYFRELDASTHTIKVLSEAEFNSLGISTPDLLNLEGTISTTEDASRSDY